MLKRLAALILVGMGLVPAVASAQQAAPPTTTPPAAPIPAPAPTQEPTGLGTNGARRVGLGVLQRLDASLRRPLQQADDPANAAYTAYGDTCAGRQVAGTGLLCTRVFLDGPGMGQPVGPTTTVAAPTTTATPVRTPTQTPVQWPGA